MVIGLLPILKKFITIPVLPTEGMGYSVMVAFFGVLAMVVGLVGFQGVVKPKIG